MRRGDKLKDIGESRGIRESDTGLAPLSQWDLVKGKQSMDEVHPLQVVRCMKIIETNSGIVKYMKV